MLEVVVFFLGVAIVFYTIFGGADFGAGVLSLFTRGEHRDADLRVMGKAIGPVWEANHIWLIVIVVILFNGFPRVYAEVSIAFHIPLTLMLLGIISRGSAYAFRHNDPFEDGSHRIYDLFFAVGSLLAPFMLGVVAVASASGAAPPTGGFAERFVFPWLGAFPLAGGLFFTALSAFIAAVFLIGDAEVGEQRRRFAARARLSFAVAVGAGLVVLLAALLWDKYYIPTLANTGLAVLAAGCLVVSALGIVPLHLWLRAERVWPSRVTAAAQVALVPLGWMAAQYPVLARTRGEIMTIIPTQAPASFPIRGTAEVYPLVTTVTAEPRVIVVLGLALIAASSLVLPALGYLFYALKIRPARSA